MNKAELVNKITEAMGLPQVKSEEILSAFLDGIMSSLKNGGNVTLIGFGKFGIKKKAARKVKNPRTGVEMHVDEKLVPFFKAGKELKETIDS
ncbi:MAG TPA: HU family DNA-binding protein [Gammaproteobacteria bacterium]|nr:HU family DNA-binding protein [Gammaproteobacteria bacterium]